VIAKWIEAQFYIMKIACISDTHMQHRQLEISSCDILIHAGDFLRTGKREEVCDFFDWFENQPARYKLLVSGNHDRKVQKKLEEHNIILNSVTFLHDSGIKIENLNFWGSSCSSCASTFIKSLKGEEDDKETIAYSMIPSGTDVLITHHPPKGILDSTSHHGYSNGNLSLLKKVLQIKPKLHVFGHVHLRQGILKNTDTTFINSALVNDEEELIFKPIYFNLE
jgi:Icc-related predicted phosphoesterase